MHLVDLRLSVSAALAVVLASSCILVVDPEEYRSDPLVGGGTTTTTGPSGAAGGGGSGGAPVVCDANLQTDEANCGSCDFDCGTAECVGGVCAGSVTLDGGVLVSVAVADGMLYLVQRDLVEGTGGGGEGGAPLAAALDRGAIRTLPLDLDTSRLGLGHPVDNVVSSLAVGTVGTKRVYFSGQNNGELPLTVQACEPQECVDLPFVLGAVQVQNLVPVGPVLYVGLADYGIGTSSVVSLSIDEISGVPAGAATSQITSFEPPMAAYPMSYGLHRIGYTDVPEPSLLMSAIDLIVDETLGGAIYRAPIGELPLLGGGDDATPWGDSSTLQAFVAAPDGAVFVRDVLGVAEAQLLRIAGTPPATTVFDTNAGAQLAADESFLYMSSTGTPQVVRALALDGSGEVAQSAGSPTDVLPIQEIDARHPDYVFYIQGNTVRRWPKPRR